MVVLLNLPYKKDLKNLLQIQYECLFQNGNTGPTDVTCTDSLEGLQTAANPYFHFNKFINPVAVCNNSYLYPCYTWTATTGTDQANIFSDPSLNGRYISILKNDIYSD